MQYFLQCGVTFTWSNYILHHWTTFIKHTHTHTHTHNPSSRTLSHLQLPSSTAHTHTCWSTHYPACITPIETHSCTVRMSTLFTWVHTHTHNATQTLTKLTSSHVFMQQHHYMCVLADPRRKCLRLLLHSLQPLQRQTNRARCTPTPGV